MPVFYRNATDMTTQSYRLLHLLQATNGGVVTYRLIERNLWPKGNAPIKYHSLFTAIRHFTGLGIVHHRGIGYQLAPELDIPDRVAAWVAKKNPAGEAGFQVERVKAAA